jgi:hypothetical protein
MLSLTLKAIIIDLKFIYSIQKDCLFQANHDICFKEYLHYDFGMNLPNQGMSCKTKALCDKNAIHYFSYGTEKHQEFYQVAHFCVQAFGKVGYVYDIELLLNGISKLTFIKEKPATPWESGQYFYSVDKKRMKKWFKQNHNRLLCSEKKTDHKI